jgi:hypothetical protein
MNLGALEIRRLAVREVQKRASQSLISRKSQQLQQEMQSATITNLPQVILDIMESIKVKI